MVTYEVSLQVDDTLVAAVERYMRQTHIPQILATGCFARITFERASPVRFRTRYQARGQGELERYLRDHTEHFRADFLARFPSGVTFAREVWEEVEDWGRK